MYDAVSSEEKLASEMCTARIVWIKFCITDAEFPLLVQVLQLKADLPLKVEVSTVDRYQGKENEVILFSCVRTQLTANMVSNSQARTVL